MDPINDMLNIIKNAQAAGKETASISFSNLKYEIAKVLERENFIGKIEKKGRGEKRFVEITLKYEDKIPAISGIKIISKPGQRIYTPARKIRKVKGGYGIAIISTSKGLMTEKEARRNKLGGEIICEIW